MKCWVHIALDNHIGLGGRCKSVHLFLCFHHLHNSLCLGSTFQRCMLSPFRNKDTWKKQKPLKRQGVAFCKKGALVIPSCLVSLTSTLSQQWEKQKWLFAASCCFSQLSCWWHSARILFLPLCFQFSQPGKSHFYCVSLTVGNAHSKITGMACSPPVTYSKWD